MPAFGGLLAPRWRSDARGVILGLSSYTSRGHIVRALLEAIAWQVADVAIRTECALLWSASERSSTAPCHMGTDYASLSSAPFYQSSASAAGMLKPLSSLMTETLTLNCLPVRSYKLAWC